MMPSDVNPRNIEGTAIALNHVTERLRRCGADNVILLLDACRNDGDRDGEGLGIEKQQGVVTLFACSPSERSYEIEALQQGAFTHTLLQGLRLQGEGNCATVERLDQYLRYRVPELNRRYNKPPQTPYTNAEPIAKRHLILLPQKATLTDVMALKNDALEAEAKRNWEVAEQLWVRVLAASPADQQAISGIRRLAQIPAASPADQQAISGIRRLAQIPAASPADQQAISGIRRLAQIPAEPSSIRPSKRVKEILEVLGGVVGFGTVVWLLWRSVPALMPATSPSSQKSSALNQAPGRFYCGTDKGSPATLVDHPNRGIIVFIRWTKQYWTPLGSTPLERCKEVSSRFQKNKDYGKLNYIIRPSAEGYLAICASESKDTQCSPEQVLILLPPKIKPDEIIKELEEINSNTSASPVEL
ncbi:COP23 domain-containing protein [Leptolyngbya sp. Cla-17]|uniref:COP23 domain-containing protein n=1 Tax=Leptolyngbya sp. Cla-17 TaxID=2803751 RepID=UPI0039F4AF97